jgi:hypothetical protein
MYTGKNELMRGREGKPEQKFDAAFGTVFRITKCFQRSKQKHYIYFSLEQGRIEN